MEFESVKDNGIREEFPTGSKRDTAKGKGRFDLIPAYPMFRLAKHYENGALKYGDWNWTKGQPISRYLASAERHLYCFKAGLNDEDHLSAIIWNIMSIIDTQRRIELDALPKELNDIPLLYNNKDPRI